MKSLTHQEYRSDRTAVNTLRCASRVDALIGLADLIREGHLP